jgi:hypothetical protein
MKNIQEEALIKKGNKIKPKNYFNFENTLDRKALFVYFKARIFSFINFDPHENYLLSSYKKEEYSQLFEVNANNFEIENIHFIKDFIYCFEIMLFEEKLVLLGLNKNLVFVVNLFNLNERKVIKTIEMGTMTIDQRSLKCFTQEQFGDESLVFLYNAKIVKDSLFIQSGKDENCCGIVNCIDLQTNKLDQDAMCTNAKCIYLDNFKSIYVKNNNIFIYNIDRPLKSLSSCPLLYTLNIGSLTIKPKSFIDNPHNASVSILTVTDSSIIVAIGNLIRVYSFIN